MKRERGVQVAQPGRLGQGEVHRRFVVEDAVGWHVRAELIVCAWVRQDRIGRISVSPKGPVPAHTGRGNYAPCTGQVPVPPPHRRRGSACNRLEATRAGRSRSLSRQRRHRGPSLLPAAHLPLPKTTNERPDRSEWPKCAKPRMNPSPVPRVVSMV